MPCEPTLQSNRCSSGFRPPITDRSWSAIRCHKLPQPNCQRPNKKSARPTYRFCKRKGRADFAAGRQRSSSPSDSLVHRRMQSDAANASRENAVSGYPASPGSPTWRKRESSDSSPACQTIISKSCGSSRGRPREIAEQRQNRGKTRSADANRSAEFRRNLIGKPSGRHRRRCCRRRRPR